MEHKNNWIKPIITHSPSDVFSTDSVLEFTCQATGYPKPIIVWYDAMTGKQVIDEIPSSGTTSGIHVNQHYGKLLVSSPERGKLYSFYCNASNSAGWTISQPPVRGGSVYISSQFKQIPVDKTVHEGDKVVMECIPPIGLPEVKVYWLKNNNLISAQNGVKPKNNISVINEFKSNIEISIDGSLHINPVTIKDSGTYTCVASNIAGEQVSPSAYLIVKSRTRFLETPVDIRVKKGRDIKLKCKVEGNHVVKWKRGPGEEPIDPHRAELTESYLLIRNAQISDSGTYICTAAGGIEADATVTVDTPPAFSVTPDDLTVNEGETAVFHCIAAGHPLPSIYWELPDKTPIFPGDQTINEFHNGKHYLTPEGSLEVRDVRQKDSGKYQCTAHSSIDTIHTSATLHVINLSKKKVDSSKDVYSLSENEPSQFSSSNFYWLAPIIGLPPPNQTRTVGEIVTLDCELGLTRGLPGSLASTLPYSDLSDWSIGWYRSTKDGVKENIDISNLPYDQRYTLLPRGSLQISNLRIEDSGNYTCLAKAVIKPYIDESLVSFTLQSNWTSYLDVVPEGSPATAAISNESPLPPPENLKATNVTSSTVILVWDLPFPPLPSQEFTRGSPMNSRQITYWVELYRPDRPTDGWIVVEKNWHAHTVQLGGLQPETIYYFLIRPRWNEGRVGWASAPLGPVLTLKEQVLSHQEVQLSDRESLKSFKNVNLILLHLYPLSPKRVRVSWSITEVPPVLSMVKGYFVYHREVPLMKCISNKLEGIYSDATGLTTKNGERMYCSIKSTTSLDSHSLFRLETMQTLQQNFKNKQEQEFNNATSDPWTVIDIKTQYQKDRKFSEIHNALTIQETSLLRDLDAFRCYEIKVKAYSSNSLMKIIESRESNTLKVLTFESFPSSPPDKIFAIWISNTTIELSWDPPPVIHWNGLLMGYIIYVYDEDASNHQNFNLSYTEQKTLIKGLTGKTIYFVQMAAVTCKGIGVRSAPIQLKPDLRKKGLGVGWGFNIQTGKLLQFMNIERKEINDKRGEDFINQPWLIVTVICSLLVWCATVALITFCCRYQRYRFRKSPGTVLIANHSQCGSIADGSNNIGTSINNSMNENKISKSSHLLQKDHVQLEPLLRSETPNMENDNCLESMDKGKYVGWHHYPSTTQNQTLHNMTTNSHNEFNNTESCDTQFNSFNPALLALSHSPCILNETNNVGLYATAENITNTIVHNNHHPNIQSNNTQTNHHILQGPNTLIPFPNDRTSRTSYLSYQSHIIPQSQINTNIPNGYHNIDQNFSSVTRIGLTSLPLIAPVAPINSLQHINESIPSSHSIHDCHGQIPQLTVAPYATASLIHNALNGNKNTSTKNCTSPTFYTMNNGVYDDNIDTPSELTYEFDENVTPSVSTKCNLLQTQLQTNQPSYTNACYRTSNNEENGNLPQFSSPGQHDLVECSQRQEIRNKSNSATSSSLTNDDEKSYRWKKTLNDQLTNELDSNYFKQNHSKMIVTTTTTTTTTATTSQQQNSFTSKSEQGEGYLFCYNDKQIILPPPPKSPPPPAPRYNHTIHDNNDNIINYQCSPIKIDEHQEYSSSSSLLSSSSSLTHTPHSSASITNDMKPIPQSYPMIITSKHKETEYLLSTNNHHHHHQHNNQSPINKQNIYYSNFCSSDDERENEQIQNKNSINGSIMNGTKYSNHPHQHPYQQHQHQPYQHRDPSLNSSYSIDKQSFIQKPIMSLNENELPNTASSTTFCIKLNPEEHSSSTYAQVY
uniref:Axon guidance protein n=1 Tax=Schistosoma mansoni TaxID=6183 RepID=A0A3Q0KTG6_SCHMA